MNLKAFYLLSPLSRLVDDTSISNAINFAHNNNDKLDIYAVTEKLSYVESILTGDSIEVIEIRIENALKHYSITNGIRIFRTEDFSLDSDLVYFQNKVSKLVNDDSSIRNLVLHYTYRNLHPRLKKLNIKNQRDPIVLKLSVFLVHEISFYLWLRNKKGYKCQYIQGERGRFFPEKVSIIYRMICRSNNKFDHVAIGDS